MNKKTIFKKVILILIFLSNVGIGIYFYAQYNKAENQYKRLEKELATVKKELEECKNSASCDAFSWTEKFVEIKSGYIPWVPCENEKACLVWEDYTQKNTPTVKIKGCEQQGTRIENGRLITGLPIGEH